MSFSFDEIKEKKLFSLIKNQTGSLKTLCPEERFLELKNHFSSLLKRIFQKKWKVILIAGTNGKGETAHSLNELFLSQGMKTALWTSPHILSLRERFHFDDEDVSYQELEAVLESYEENDSLGFYENLLAVFLELCLKKNPDVLILEVGVGGRFDVVNLLEPDLSLITSIGRDHENILGRGHKRILFEKLGISRPHKPLLTALELAYQRENCRSYCEKEAIVWEDLFELQELHKSFHYSKRNKMLALHAFKILTGRELPFFLLEGRFFKGRGEILSQGNQKLLFIGAHNHDGVRKMVEGLKSGHLANDFSFPFDTILVSFSKRPKEEISACLHLLAEDSSLGKRVILTSFEHVKAMEGETLSKFKGLVHFEADWKTIFSTLQGTILVTGSYYFVGEVQRFLVTRSSSH